MPVTGWILPTANTVEAGSGTWTNDTNILADDGSEATFALTSKNTSGRWNAGQTFGFDSLIPAGATITKVEIRAEWRVNNAGGIANLGLQSFVSGAGVGAVRENTAEPTTLTTDTYDVTADRSWVRSDLLNGTFELKCRGRNGNSATDPSYRFDHIAAQITYTTTFDQSLSAAVTTAAALSREAGKIVTAAVIGVASMVRQVARTVTAAVTVSATSTRETTHTLTAASVVQAALTASRAFLRTLEAAVTGVGSMTRQTGKILTAAPLAVATLEATRAFLKTLDAAVTVSGSMLRQVGKLLTAATAAVASLATEFISGAPSVPITLPFGSRLRGLAGSSPDEQEFDAPSQPPERGQ